MSSKHRRVARMGSTNSKHGARRAAWFEVGEAVVVHGAQDVAGEVVRANAHEVIVRHADGFERAYVPRYVSSAADAS